MNAITPLLQQLYTKFRTDSTLSALFPSFTIAGTSYPVRFFPGVALDGAPMPYCTSNLITGDPAQIYGGNGPSSVDIQFTVTEVGYIACSQAADSVVAVLDAWACPVSLAAGAIISVRRTTNVILLLSDDQADASGNDIWDASVTYEFTVD
jgi:hypothetical protein